MVAARVGHRKGTPSFALTCSSTPPSRQAVHLCKAGVEGCSPVVSNTEAILAWPGAVHRSGESLPR